jgi:biotin-dependent carboxylase-like uncharacterized protein
MIEVLSCGALTTVQDLGRSGHRRVGVGLSGAMDPVALRTANALLGNDPNAACIEITASAFRARFQGDIAFAICGSDAAAELSGLPIPPWWAHRARGGDELTLRAPKTGMRTYLSVRGGIDVPFVLGSRSTDVKSAFGGHEGRMLQGGDRLGWCPAVPAPLPERGFGVTPANQALTVAAPCGSTSSVIAVRVIPAAQYDDFPPSMLELFWGNEWVVRPESNRMGLRLSGPDLIPSRHEELLSHGILPGVVQVPPGGQPIVQACDANTVGGYPKIAVVIEPDLWRLGQVRLGGRIRFVEAGRADAEAAAAQLDDYLLRIQRSARLARGLQ